MKSDLAAILLTLVLGPLIVMGACYATTGPVPTCAQDPSQSWCWHPAQAEHADAGR